MLLKEAIAEREAFTDKFISAPKIPLCICLTFKIVIYAVTKLNNKAMHRLPSASN